MNDHVNILREAVKWRGRGVALANRGFDLGLIAAPGRLASGGQ